MIRDAVVEDAENLTSIAFAAKRFWNYPEDYLQLWKDELTITTDYIKYNFVRVYLADNKVVGFYSCFKLEEQIKFSSGYMESGDWLDHMFIYPEYHKRGIGTQMFEDIKLNIKSNNLFCPIRIFVDPNAVGFYDKMGAKSFRMSGSSIPGREIPVYIYA